MLTKSHQGLALMQAMTGQPGPKPVPGPAMSSVTDPVNGGQVTGELANGKLVTKNVVIEKLVTKNVVIEKLVKRSVWKKPRQTLQNLQQWQAENGAETS
jgi:hypothetical protein